MDLIAKRAKINKALIYHHFQDKDALFHAVLEKVYSDLRVHNIQVVNDNLGPQEGIRALILHTFDFFVKHPEFMSIVNNENLLEGRHLKKSNSVQLMFAPLLEYLTQLLEKGAQEGVFREGIDAVQLYISISGIGYFFLSNSYTLREVFGIPLFDSTFIEARRHHVVDLVMGYITNVT